MNTCFKCGAKWVSEARRPAFKEICESCTAYLHCCKNCRFHDWSAHNECRVGTTEWVADRVRANYCEEFEFIDEEARMKSTDDSGQAREKLDGLFGGALGESETPPSDFDKLFDD